MDVIFIKKKKNSIDIVRLYWYQQHGTDVSVHIFVYNNYLHLILNVRNSKISKFLIL